MAKKSWLFIGIILLVIGILIRRLSELDAIGLILILGGVAFKTIYIIGKMKSGEYKPGLEMSLLVIGLLLFLGGIYMRNNDLELLLIPALFFIIAGLALKVMFIIGFIKKLKESRVNNFDNKNADATP
jgi:1,4-dihydroxy-2-naphthoate octaprenyltransferase